MKKIIVIISLLLMVNLNSVAKETEAIADSDSLQEVLSKVSEEKREDLKDALIDAGKNKSQLMNAILQTDKQKQDDAVWMILHMPHLDRLEMKTETLLEHITYAYQTKESFNYSVPDSLFRQYILTYRINREPVVPWRKKLFDYFSPMIAEANTVEEAAKTINQWIEENMSTHEREFFGPQQSPVITLTSRSGTESEISIFTTAVLKAIGIPSRFARVRYFGQETGGEHWVEIFSDNRWIPLYPFDSENFGNFSLFENQHKENITVVSTSSAFEWNLVTDHYTETGNLELQFTANNQPKKNFKHFSINVFNDGAFRSLDDIYTKADSNGIFNVELGNGTYKIETGLRSNTGSVYVQLFDVVIKADSTTMLPIDLTPPPVYYSDEYSVQADKEIPTFFLPDLNGDIRSPDDGAQKKAMILVVFNDEEEPCIRMLPKINEFYQNVEKSVKKQIILYGIFLGNAANARSFKHEWNIEFPIIIDAQKRLMDEKTDLPQIIGMDKNRSIKMIEQGYNLNISSVLEKFVLDFTEKDNK